MVSQIKSALVALAVASQAIFTLSAQEVKFNHEATDTARITTILIKEAGMPSPGSVTRIAEQFVGTPYAGGTLEGDSIETLRVNLDSLDCTTYVETVLALAYTAAEHRSSWRDFTYNLRRIRYRNGDINGYPSRLHYVSDWIVDNGARGILQEITTASPKVRYRVKSLDFMSTHRKLYPALADDENYYKIKSVEAGFSNHRYPYIKGAGLKGKQIAEVAQDGDIVIFTTSTPGLDATHMGIIKMADGTPMLLHASSKEKKVVLDQLSLADYIARNRPEGIRLVRMTVK